MGIRCARCAPIVFTETNNATRTLYESILYYTAIPVVFNQLLRYVTVLRPLCMRLSGRPFRRLFVSLAKATT